MARQRRRKFPRKLREPRAGVWGIESLEPSAAAKRADALRLVAETFLACRSEEIESTSSADRYQLVVHVDEAVLVDEVTARTDEPHRSELDAGPALALDTVRRLGCDGTIVGILEGRDGEPLNIGRKTRSIPPAIDRALRARDGGCRFPGCDRTRFTQGHHVKHWADGGETKLANLVTLCSFHHGLVHEGGFGVTATDDGVFVFTRPDGRRIPECAPLSPMRPAGGAGSFRGNFADRERRHSWRSGPRRVRGLAALVPAEASIPAFGSTRRRAAANGSASGWTTASRSRGCSACATARRRLNALAEAPDRHAGPPP